MAKSRILLQLDGDPQPSTFDAVVAIDADVDHLLRHGGVTPESVRELVYGCIFTRGMDDLSGTAIFVGGSRVELGEQILEAVKATFVGPLKVSVMLDANGANTTAAAAVLAARSHLDLEGAEVTVLAATGPVGQRVARLLAREGATVRLGSRSLERSRSVCDAIARVLPEAELVPLATDSPEAVEAALDGSAGVIAAGAAGVELVAAEMLLRCQTLAVAIDLNAVPPLGLGGIEPSARGKALDDLVVYGALGVGATKMKIHKAALRRLFTAHDLVLDADEIYDLGCELFDA